MSAMIHDFDPIGGNGRVGNTGPTISRCKCGWSDRTFPNRQLAYDAWATHCFEAIYPGERAARIEQRSTSEPTS